MLGLRVTGLSGWGKAYGFTKCLAPYVNRSIDLPIDLLTFYWAFLEAPLRAWMGLRGRGRCEGVRVGVPGPLGRYGVMCE